MKRLAAMSVALWTAVPTSLPAICEEAIAKSQSLKCEIGPLLTRRGLFTAAMITRQSQSSLRQGTPPCRSISCFPGTRTVTA